MRFTSPETVTGRLDNATIAGLGLEGLSEAVAPAPKPVVTRTNPKPAPEPVKKASSSEMSVEEFLRRSKELRDR